MDDLLNVDLQEQSPSAEETASGNAIVTLFEIYLANSDLGGAGTDKLYFHDGTKTPTESYADIQNRPQIHMGTYKCIVLLLNLIGDQQQHQIIL